jgi:hypothetical protein
MFRKLKNKIKIWAVTEIFKLYFGSFLYPFEKADEKFENLSAFEKAKYLKDVSNWVNSDAFRIESQEILRKYYQDLACKPLDNVTATGYRLALLVEQDKERRLLKRAKEFDEIVSID